MKVFLEKAMSVEFLLENPEGPPSLSFTSSYDGGEDDDHVGRAAFSWLPFFSGTPQHHPALAEGGPGPVFQFFSQDALGFGGGGPLLSVSTWVQHGGEIANGGNQSKAVQERELGKKLGSVSAPRGGGGFAHPCSHPSSASAPASSSSSFGSWFWSPLCSWFSWLGSSLFATGYGSACYSLGRLEDWGIEADSPRGGGGTTRRLYFVRFTSSANSSLYWDSPGFHVTRRKIDALRLLIEEKGYLWNSWAPIMDDETPLRIISGADKLRIEWAYEKLRGDAFVLQLEKRNGSTTWFGVGSWILPRVHEEVGFYIHDLIPGDELQGGGVYRYAVHYLGKNGSEKSSQSVTFSSAAARMHRGPTLTIFRIFVERGGVLGVASCKEGQARPQCSWWDLSLMETRPHAQVLTSDRLRVEWSCDHEQPFTLRLQRQNLFGDAWNEVDSWVQSFSLPGSPGSCGTIVSLGGASRLLSDRHYRFSVVPKKTFSNFVSYDQPSLAEQTSFPFFMGSSGAPICGLRIDVQEKGYFTRSWVPLLDNNGQDPRTLSSSDKLRAKWSCDDGQASSSPKHGFALRLLRENVHATTFLFGSTGWEEVGYWWQTQRSSELLEGSFDRGKMLKQDGKYQFLVRYIYAAVKLPDERSVSFYVESTWWSRCAGALWDAYDFCYEVGALLLLCVAMNPGTVTFTFFLLCASVYLCRLRNCTFTFTFPTVEVPGLLVDPPEAVWRCAEQNLRQDFPEGLLFRMYHGTSASSAQKISAEARFRPSADGMLGRGVYLSRDLAKARCYP